VTCRRATVDAENLLVAGYEPPPPPAPEPPPPLRPAPRRPDPRAAAAGYRRRPVATELKTAMQVQSRGGLSKGCSPEAGCSESF
jgi:hypothetical protein